MAYLWQVFSADTNHNNNIIITLKRRRFDATTTLALHRVHWVLRHWTYLYHSTSVYWMIIVESSTYSHKMIPSLRVTSNGGGMFFPRTALIQSRACCFMSSSPWKYMGIHNDVRTWVRFPYYWPFVRGIHRSPVYFMWLLIHGRIRWSGHRWIPFTKGK